MKILDAFFSCFASRIGMNYSKNLRKKHLTNTMDNLISVENVYVKFFFLVYFANRNCNCTTLYKYNQHFCSYVRVS